MHVVILGCGQLSRLMAREGKKLGVDFTFVAMGDESTDCVNGLGKIVQWQDSMSAEALLAETGTPDALTVERESIDVKLLIELQKLCNVCPPPEAVAACQHRLKEKMALTSLDIPATPWHPISDEASLHKAAEMFGYPLIVKSFEDGYDGKNQWHLQSADELAELVKTEKPENWLAEPKINFTHEVSLIGARSVSGEVKFYPITENHHEGGILKRSIAPYELLDSTKIDEMQANMKRLMESWQYVGVLAIEMFVTKDGFTVNEMAPRVHNSGHWTQNNTITSQFENHIRAILDMELGDTEVNDYSGMVNILGMGTQQPKVDHVEGEVFLYDKTPRNGRKLGHVNLSDSDRESLAQRMSAIESQIYSN
ncbi:5-(carboxyamino)imidazole ribonucleotide synthase [Aliikangiella marina]|uniref:N5-carboxyaminoimidazole ribonucleotide synthase n=1 Tax=Aliikangiella marina TaxID=1712262 RepID=A0A545TJL5_9GAMM|nr:5-(carboxyamino)imidazole ribonucleotide synthase [Aliikangiella marina]TQV77419.1 5-(carboxyamino)imidazole ribonucleotide synthase [Aliikangiella marina]